MFVLVSTVNPQGHSDHRPRCTVVVPNDTDLRQACGPEKVARIIVVHNPNYRALSD